MNSNVNYFGVNKIKKVQKKPVIRFSGFTNEWEQQRVANLFEITRGYVLAVNKTTEEKTNKNRYPVYSSQTLNNGLLGYYHEYLYEDTITWTTDGANAGTVNFRSEKFYCTNVCGVLLSKKVKADKMIAEALNNVAKSYVSYVGNPKLMNNVMAGVEIMIPTNEEEREKISNIFATLDHLVTLHQLKLEKLKNIKESLLEKMFPKNNADKPLIRFKGYTYAWEQVKLGEIVNKFNNLRVPVEESLRVKGSTPYYGANGIQDYVKGYTHDGEFVLIAEDGANNLLNYPVQYVSGKIWVNNHAHVLQGKENILNNKFFSYSINSIDMEQYIVGGSRSKLNATTLMDIELKIPSIQEQKLLGNLFYTIDNLLALHQRKCQKLQNIKEAILEKMFC